MPSDETKDLILTELSTLPKGKVGRRVKQQEPPAPREWPKMTHAEAKQLERLEAKDLARLLVTDPFYLISLQERLRDGRLPPAVETTLWGYAYGKPKEQIEVRKASVVKILHEYADNEEVRKVAEKVLEGETLGTNHQDPVERTTD